MAATESRPGLTVNTVVHTALTKGSRCQRLSREEALAITQIKSPEGLHKCGQAGLQNRTIRFHNKASYIKNLFINPSNICSGKCNFCHYWAEENDPKAYILDEETILDNIKARDPDEIHIVGGLNTVWPFSRNLALIKTINRTWPKIFIKAFTAVEIDYFATQEKTTPKDILSSLQQAGVQSLTGGGAEQFSPRLRKQLCPTKLSPESWLAIHKTAHQLRLYSNATMLYGVGETSEEIVDHLLRLRDLQDETSGFSCFIPLAHQPARGQSKSARPGINKDLLIVALARLILDNFRHIKAYWPMIGLETTAVALSWGADDLDGTIGDEKIAHAGQASSPRSLSRAKLEDTIRLGGFIPFARDGLFNPVLKKG